ncbi:MAG: RNA polymerase sigma factor RpoD/SigA [Candidatus Latescibacterota bacterium]
MTRYETNYHFDSDRSGPTSFDIYLQQINRIPLLSAEEEAEVARRAKNGDEKALDQLVQANLRFVVSVAKRYANQGVPMEDLVNEGNIGLMKAARRFDVDRGFKFISYAVWWIRQAILVSLSHGSRIVRLPLNRSNLLYKIGRASRELDQEMGRAPTTEEIAEHIGVSADEVEETMRIANNHVSLDTAMSDEGDDPSYLAQLEDEESTGPDEYVDGLMLGESTARALQTLNGREREIIRLYFGLGGEEPLTLEDIGKHLGLTRERIRQIKEQAIQKLRHRSRSKYLKDFV